MNQAVTNLVGNLGKSASFLCGGQARFFHQEALGQAFFSTSPKKLMDEKTQNSRKNSKLKEKLKTQAQNSRFRHIW